MIAGFIEWLKRRAIQARAGVRWDKQYRAGVAGAHGRRRRKNPLRGIVGPRIYANEDKNVTGTVSVQRHV